VNLDTCAICQFFLELSVWGRIAVIAGYILMTLLIVLWEHFRRHRHNTTRSPMVMPIEKTEKFVHTITACPSKQNQYNPYKRQRHLLETFRINLRHSIIYCKSRDDSNNPAYHFQQHIVKHISTIVNKLRRRVNESGKEPCCLLTFNSSLLMV
jgi:hypothetical protein